MPVPRKADANRCVTGAGMAASSSSSTGNASPPQQQQPAQAAAAQQQQQQKLTPQQQQFLMQQMYMQQQQRYMMQQQQQQGGGGRGMPQTPNFTVQQRDRNAGVITDEEAEGIEQINNDSGRGFRRALFVFVLVMVVLLGFAKNDLENGVGIPAELARMAERDAEIRGDAAAVKKSTDGTAATATTASASADEEEEKQRQEEEYYRLLNVEERIHDEATDDELLRAEEEVAKARAAEGGDSITPEEAVRRSRQEADRQRRLDNWRVKQQLKRNYEAHLEDYGQLVACGQECQAQHQQLQLAFETLNGKVDRELVGVLEGINVNEVHRATTDQDELKSKYESNKEKIEKTVDDEEVKTMELAELRDAYEILANPDARNFYYLYGRKPPEAMKHTDTKYGGWGQELLLRTHKNRLVLAWLDYLGDSWADYTVLGLIGFVGFILPAAVQLPRIIEMAKEIEERQVQMEEMEKRVQQGQSATLEPAAAAAAAAS